MDLFFDLCNLLSHLTQPLSLSPTSTVVTSHIHFRFNIHFSSFLHFDLTHLFSSKYVLHLKHLDFDLTYLLPYRNRLLSSEPSTFIQHISSSISAIFCNQHSQHTPSFICSLLQSHTSVLIFHIDADLTHLLRFSPILCIYFLSSHMSTPIPSRLAQLLPSHITFDLFTSDIHNVLLDLESLDLCHVGLYIWTCPSFHFLHCHHSISSRLI